MEKACRHPHLTIYQTRHKSFFFGSSIKLSENSLDRLISALETNNSKDHRNKNESILNGRGKIKSIHIPEAGHIVIKPYLRGGLIRYFNKNTYIKLHRPIRSENEFNMLIMAKQAGINVPLPLAYISRGSLFYKTWLITKKIDQCESFADISLKNKKQTVKIFHEISKTIKQLIKSRIYHVDLHPGNVLIDADGKNHIIDFDKAFFFKGNNDKLTMLYKKRWARAVLKYELPEFIADLKLDSSNE